VVFSPPPTDLVWKVVSNGPVIDAAVAIEGIEPEAFAGLERLRAILSFCGKQLAAAEPLLAVPASFDEVAAGSASGRISL
jgi:hypothetical protein